MSGKLYLHIPSFEELDYRQKILSQPDTMSYNSGYKLGIENYNNKFVGEVCFHYDKISNSHCIGIVIEAEYRGKGYCSKGLIKLEEKAFVDLNIDKLRNEIPIERKSAIAGHKKAGFKEIGVDDGKCILELSKDEYLKYVDKDNL